MAQSKNGLSVNAYPPHLSTRSRALALAGLFLVALNLRPALTSVAPVLSRIGADLGLASIGLGLLTTLPVLCLGLAAPLAPRLARRIGSERAILVVLCVLAMALLMRPYFGSIGLFTGTAVAGGAIGIMGVLLPGLVKRNFPARIGIMTGLYTVALNLGASLGAGITEPLRLTFSGDWRPALAFWFIPAIIAALVWLTQTRSSHVPTTRKHKKRSLRHEPLAWQVTAYMGLQSSLAYIVFGWLPTILADRGMSSVAAGAALSISILIQVITAILAPTFGARMRDQRVVITAAMLATLVGLMGCIYAPMSGIWLWIVLLGLGQGGAFSMALTLLALRASDPETADELSSMAQGIGYIIAACGPLAIGLIYQFTGSWSATGILIGVIGLCATVAGLGAGRDRLVGDG